MAIGGLVPDDALGFIQKCVHDRKVYWTYHVNMRLAERHITRDDIFGAVDNYEIIESNPDDKYLPSYLVFAAQAVGGFHVLFGADVALDHVRVVTAYRPHLNDWEPDLKTRRSQT